MASEVEKPPRQAARGREQAGQGGLIEAGAPARKRIGSLDEREHERARLLRGQRPLEGHIHAFAAQSQANPRGSGIRVECCDQGQTALGGVEPIGELSGAGRWHGMGLVDREEQRGLAGPVGQREQCLRRVALHLFIHRTERPGGQLPGGQCGEGEVGDAESASHHGGQILEQTRLADAFWPAEGDAGASSQRRPNLAAGGRATGERMQPRGVHGMGRRGFRNVAAGSGVGHRP